MEDQQDRPGQCRRRPSLDDLDLIAAIDGEASEEILAHLRECPHCAERARDLASFNGCCGSALPHSVPSER
jgi:hypothetical protein